MNTVSFERTALSKCIIAGCAVVFGACLAIDRAQAQTNFVNPPIPPQQPVFNPSSPYTVPQAPYKPLSSGTQASGPAQVLICMKIHQPNLRIARWLIRRQRGPTSHKSAPASTTIGTTVGPGRIEAEPSCRPQAQREALLIFLPAAATFRLLIPAPGGGNRTDTGCTVVFDGGSH
jgi:hypothetical protein